MLTYDRLALDTMNWEQLDSFPDRTIYQTLPWLRFLVETQRGEPVIAALREGRETLGYFTGMIVNKYGCRILGSPFRGWTTAYMGFNLVPGVSRQEALSALVRFAFRDLRCLHLELMDRRLSVEDGTGLELDHRIFPGYEIDLRSSEDELFTGMTSACRRCIRKAEREGVVIEEAHDPDFVDDYCAQLRDVFAKQGLVPTYGKERVRALMRCLEPTGRLLLLRARDPSGCCIATGIFPAMNDTMYFWGGASWRPHQGLRPNEAIQWHAMRYWKARGIQRYDMGGGGEYKRKYGGREISVPWMRISKYRVIANLRDVAQQLVSSSQRLSGLIRGRARPVTWDTGSGEA